jgi:hypothetical protein
MAKKIVQINFNYEMTAEELDKGAAGFVNPVLEVPGLIWKIWILNQQEKLTGGIYLFQDGVSAKAYVEGPICDQLRSIPAFRNVTMKLFDIMEEQSKTTHAPV